MGLTQFSQGSSAISSTDIEIGDSLQQSSIGLAKSRLAVLPFRAAIDHVCKFSVDLTDGSVKGFGLFSWHKFA
jgi:hypothetical protein